VVTLAVQFLQHDVLFQILGGLHTRRMPIQRHVIKFFLSFVNALCFFRPIGSVSLFPNGRDAIPVLFGI